MVRISRKREFNLPFSFRETKIWEREERSKKKHANLKASHGRHQRMIFGRRDSMRGAVSSSSSSFVANDPRRIIRTVSLKIVQSSLDYRAVSLACSRSVSPLDSVLASPPPPLSQVSPPVPLASLPYPSVSFSLSLAPHLRAQARVIASSVLNLALTVAFAEPAAYIKHLFVSAAVSCTRAR